MDLLGVDANIRRSSLIEVVKIQRWDEPFKMSSSAQAAAAEKTKQMLKEMPLQELRQAHQMSQERMAILPHTKQANILRIERRTDMYISTLPYRLRVNKHDVMIKFYSF